MKPYSIEVLFGGASSERLVSTASAQNILENVPEASAIFLSASGALFRCQREEVLSHKNPFTEEFNPISLLSPQWSSLEDALQRSEFKKSVLVLALHGQGVEDGTLQLKLERAKVAFTGSCAKSSAVAFDKLASKKVATAHHVRVAQHQELHSGNSGAVLQTLTSCIRQYERIAVKPVADGSSVGLYILDGRSNLEGIATSICKEGRSYLIEEFIAGTELTVGVVGDGERARALTPSEVRLNSGANFDYNAKYLGKGVEELTPARVSPDVTRAAQEVALKMHRALECEGYSRTDMIVTRTGPVYLETNTLPGMTKASFFPQQLVAGGSNMKEFLGAEILRAWKRGCSQTE